MLLALAVFVMVAGGIVGAYVAFSQDARVAGGRSAGAPSPRGVEARGEGASVLVKQQIVWRRRSAWSAAPTPVPGSPA